MGTIDMSAAKAPPKRSTARKAAPEPAPAPALSLTELRNDGLLGLASLGAGVCLMLGQYADAMTVNKFFPPIAREVAKIADTNESVAKPIDFIIKVGPYGALLAALIPFSLQIMANHQIIDASRALGQGIVPPEVLEAQMKAEVARMQAEAIMAQQQAVNEANEAAAAYEKLMQSMAAKDPAA